MEGVSYKELDRGWAWVVMVAAFGSMFITGGLNFSVGLIHATLLERYHEGQSATSVVPALHTAIMNMAAPLSSLMIDQFSVRTAVVASGFLFTTGYLGTAFAPSLGLTVFTCGIVAGLGGALGWTAAMLAPGLHFHKYRNLAIGFAMTGNAVGLLSTAPAVQTAREVYGTSGFFIALACISIHQIVFGMLMRPSSLEIQIQRNRSLPSNRSGKKSNSIATTFAGYFKVCTTVSLSVLSLSFLFICLAHYAIFMHLPNFCIYSGYGPMKASYMLSVVGISSIFGRLATGYLANIDRLKEIYLHSGSLLGIGLAALFVPLYGRTYEGTMVFAVIVGFFFGTPFVTATPINIRLVGESNMAAALGNELFMGGIGAIIGPITTSFLLDKGLGYPTVFVISGVVYILAACLGLLAIMLATDRRCGVGKATERAHEICVAEKEAEKMLE